MNKNKKENSGEEVFLTTKQASEFTGYKESYLRKLTMRRQIAFFSGWLSLNSFQQVRPH